MVTVPLRQTTHPAVAADCLVCGLPLPPIVVDVYVRAEGGRLTLVEATLEPLTAAWWDVARAEHPGCIPESCRCGARLDAGHCVHCHDAPPSGHQCARCGRLTDRAGRVHRP